MKVKVNLKVKVNRVNKGKKRKIWLKKINKKVQKICLKFLKNKKKKEKTLTKFKIKFQL